MESEGNEKNSQKRGRQIEDQGMKLSRRVDVERKQLIPWAMWVIRNQLEESEIRTLNIDTDITL